MHLMSNLTPREIVSELDRYIIGQDAAKRMVAIAMRNRWRRQQLDPELRDDIAPKNIILMGPTGVGKTEIARRLARLANCPFFKVEATKFTEVGYVGRDVESMIRDLMEIGVNMVRKEETEKVRIKAEKNAEERLLDLLLPRSKPGGGQAGFFMGSQSGEIEEKQETGRDDATREKFRQMFRAGQLDEREVELEVRVQSGAQVEIMAIPGMEGMGSNLQSAFANMFPSKRKQRKMKIREAYLVLVDEEAEKLIDPDAVNELARERVEQQGILFLDELDKIASRHDQAGGADVSREGVQRDLLPVVEGSVVNTKYGMVKTDHILFIAAGAFHFAKPSDLIPELQGRFPLREALDSLHKEEFYRILTEPRNALTVQYKALLGTEGVSVDFTREALEEIAATAEKINEETENIGARRLYTIMEKILANLSYEAPDKSGVTVVIDRDYVLEQLGDVVENRDLSRYIL
ncbi:MAG: ATP-dependent protease ATPase subunit HslU [Pseudodesulfovibrio sp.]|nr:ATP-dependent protease ATPase subunit HslU [Pseudomonadota bacterium]MBV1764041.1 ATP-dependent protease ATPase subunit HslU [Pseudodesulfovibrio sp.]MCG2734446.1 ATP-dependent protease ATPase subunit HslU [Pseudodesulfovibrio aespoeensis]MBU4244636.1 ATP-dependent protease ATPase subunit HslU [Pseudomonadota bacterium]MBU4379553.1 ATP-dependent protease ATPase subunit HslU [Pseudomonadota bacterium]